MKTLRSCVWIAAVMLAAPAWAQDVENGVGSRVRAEFAAPTGMNFDPPCLFGQTLPLMAAPYMDPATMSHFVDGEGTVLNSCGNFGVTGFSAPNFLAWNCNARNLDGTRPALPAEIKFLEPMQFVSVRVGSSANAGSTATLAVFNAAHTQIGSTSVVLNPALQTLQLRVAGVRYAVLRGPCVMVADDVRYSG